MKPILTTTLLLLTISILQAQTYLHKDATVGTTLEIATGELIIGNTGELFFGAHQPPLQQVHKLVQWGNFEGEEGANFHISITNNSNQDGSRGFFAIIGTAIGSTEIIVDMHPNWDGADINVVMAYDAGSDPQAFTMQEQMFNGILAELRSGIEGNDRIWYVSKKQNCLPIIHQKQNNTLVVDNNPTTNGGYDFVFYEWYRNGELVHRGGWGAGMGGIFNTGRNPLNPLDEYHVILTDSDNKEYQTCPFNPTVFVYETLIIAYPNPAPIHSSTVIIDIQTNDEELLKNGVITAYELLGRQVGQPVRTNGHRHTPIQLPTVAGTYLLRFVSGDYAEVLRVIVN
jgi:hypothetical protein